MLKDLLKKKKNFIIILIILVILFTIFVMRPGIIGYSTYQQVKSSNYSIEDYGKNIQELKSKLLISDTNLSSCSTFNKKLFTELDKSSEKFSNCNSDLRVLETNFDFSKKDYEETLKDLNADLNKKNKEIDELEDQKEEEINDLELQYNLLAQNTANNVCCKAKVDNSDIKYYKVENDKIICIEEGTLSILC